MTDKPIVLVIGSGAAGICSAFGTEVAVVLRGVRALALAVRARMTAAEIQATPAVHPSYAEALNWAAW